MLQKQYNRLLKVWILQAGSGDYELAGIRHFLPREFLPLQTLGSLSY